MSLSKSLNIIEVMLHLLESTWKRTILHCIILLSLPGGYYCGQDGLSYPSGLCEAGYYCSGGSSVAMPSGVGGDQCSPGYYCPEGSIQPIGKSC